MKRAICLSVACAFVCPAIARAEKILTTTNDGWTIYTDGRAGAFMSYVHGDGRPLGTYELGNVGGTPTLFQISDVKGGGLDAATQRQPVPGAAGTLGQLTQGTIDDMRVRSGFIGNVLGVGVRGALGSSVATAYIQIWALAETDGRTKNHPNIVDVRQAYAKLEGSWGSFLAGRSRALFSRGATDIDFLYGHRYGLGYPGAVDGNGPTAGHIGFGVLGSGFAPGIVYGTPTLAGLQLNAGLFDPIQIAAGGWTRTKWPRAEAELTFEHTFRNSAKLVLFGNGAWQKLYHDGTPDSDNATAAGFGYGGRFELGAFHLGVAGHYGKGLGLTYALESSDANSDPTNNIRLFDGYYAQTMVVLGRFDVSAGWGVSRVFLNPADNMTVPDPIDPTISHIPHSVIKYQMGESAGIVFHARPWLHFDVDFFRAQFAWFLGERQVDYIANSGMTITW